MNSFFLKHFLQNLIKRLAVIIPGVSDVWGSEAATTELHSFLPHVSHPQVSCRARSDKPVDSCCKLQYSQLFWWLHLPEIPGSEEDYGWIARMPGQVAGYGYRVQRVEVVVLLDAPFLREDQGGAGSARSASEAPSASQRVIYAHPMQMAAWPRDRVNTKHSVS